MLVHTYQKEEELFKYVKQSPVTVGEYQEFMDWVRDSIARDRLFYGLDDDEHAHKFLEDHSESCTSQCMSSREEAREKYNLNWDIEIDYENTDFVPVLADMYLPQPERFYKSREFDNRKLLYSYDEVFQEYPELFISDSRNSSAFGGGAYPAAFKEMDDYPKNCWQQCPIVPDYYSIAASDTLLYTESSVISEVYGKQFIDEPVYGLLGTQASAYCKWLERKLNMEFSQKGLELRASITLPNENDLALKKTQKIVAPEFNYTEIWEITPYEYQEFVEYVSDSILQENLYFETEEDDEALNLLDFKEVYFDEGALEYVELDSKDRVINREIFNLSKSVNLDKICSRLGWLDSITGDYLNDYDNWENAISFCDFLLKTTNGLQYRYYVKDAAAMGFSGVFEYGVSNYNLAYGNDYEEFKSYKNKHGYDDEEFRGKGPKGKDLKLDGNLNELGSSAGVLGHANAQRFILSCRYLVPSEWSHPSDLSYGDALAFYCWKYPRWKIGKTKDDWQQFVFPSEEQFNKVQQGESIVVSEHEIEYPTPLFRYVVHFYNK